MYACLHTSKASIEDLLDLALEFSPAVEQTSPDTVVFSIDGLRKLIGSPHQIASEICRYGYERELRANLGIAANPDTAVLIARSFTGVTLITPGEEHFKIAAIPIKNLFSHDLPIDPELLQILTRWGLKTCEDLAALPEHGVAERLGPSGVYLRNLALGKISRPLRVFGFETHYEERLDLDYPVEQLEPLLFLLASALHEICTRLRSQSRAARLLDVTLTLEGKSEYRCQLEFPVPLYDSAIILKLLQLHLERHSPGAPILGFTVRVDPVEPRRVQKGLFLPATPPPDKLQVTLSRIIGMVGEENVGTPSLLNTHRPDAFHMTALSTAGSNLNQQRNADNPSNDVLRLAMRLFRPALHASVKVDHSMPKKIVAPGVEGKIVRSAGPWITSGDWWTPTPWNREEWDVAMDDGALYRIYCELRTCQWYVFGVYD